MPEEAEALFVKSELSVNSYSFHALNTKKSLTGYRSLQVALIWRRRAAAPAGDAVDRLTGSDDDRDVIVGIGEARDSNRAFTRPLCWCRLCEGGGARTKI